MEGHRKASAGPAQGARRLRFVALAALAATALAACGGRDAPAEVTVTGAEYSFEVADTVAPGPTTFLFENAGAEPHEMFLARVDSDRPLEELLEAPEEEVAQVTDDVGVLLATPGGDSGAGLTVDLAPGRYALVCFFEAPDGTPHAALGMVAELTVG